MLSENYINELSRSLIEKRYSPSYAIRESEAKNLYGEYEKLGTEQKRTIGLCCINLLTAFSEEFDRLFSTNMGLSTTMILLSKSGVLVPDEVETLFKIFIETTNSMFSWIVSWTKPQDIAAEGPLWRLCSRTYDVLWIWRHYLRDSAYLNPNPTTFIIQGEASISHEEKWASFEKRVNYIFKNSGLKSAFEAYKAGVPVQDILA